MLLLMTIWMGSNNTTTHNTTMETQVTEQLPTWNQFRYRYKPKAFTGTLSGREYYLLPEGKDLNRVIMEPKTKVWYLTDAETGGEKVVAGYPPKGTEPKFFIITSIPWTSGNEQFIR